MKIKLFFIFTLLFFDASTYCSCEDIIESIEICKEYTCQQYIGNEDFIEHKILGLSSKDLCVYIEKQDNDEMVCHHSKYGMMMEKKYLESIFKVGNQEINDFIDIANLRAKECFFISNQKTSYTNRDYIIKEAVESNFDVLSQYNDIKSIFFDKESVNKMVSEMKKFNLRSSRAAKEEILDNFNSKVVSLDSILYLSPDTWKIWVNRKLFTNTKNLKVYSVTENYVTFVWTVNQKMTKKQPNDSKNVYFGYGNIMFTLYPKQKFDLDSLSIK
ncbi:hypothetical protein EJB10_03270 [Wolbachia endosymbiont of Brugia malayi]|uniref:hypothetical protein n=1 Tax=Wolbachia endosymbiont of Brugia malayi TaxID=80849 RepID=UPI00004C92E5|nr:hypothetical protein [Wolbachia endosymbiont of Brugia malayi]AAW70804.1 Predicted protein [Wolbachia endosymbiont strain TRS of Brugia malayi]QCB61773.1 hypothetical protein EJB10_03270 [Wolbachia endosymbiont of Brugia malayi]